MREFPGFSRKGTHRWRPIPIREADRPMREPQCFSTCLSVPGYAWLDRTDSKQAVACWSVNVGGLPLEICPRIYDSAESPMRSKSEHCSIWWMSRCDGRVLEKNFMKTYCIRLAASA